MEALINENNLKEKTLTNAQVLFVLNKLSMNLDMCGYSRTLDVIEDLTNDRNFSEDSIVEKVIKEQGKDLSLMLAKINALNKG